MRLLLVWGAILDVDVVCLGSALGALGMLGMPTNGPDQMLTPKICGCVKRTRNPYGNASMKREIGLVKAGLWMKAQ